MEHALHKVTVEVEERAWLNYKALCATQGKTVQRAIGQMIERETRAAERKQAQRLGRSRAAKRAMEKALDEIRQQRPR
jgi:hypothetical protein